MPGSIERLADTIAALLAREGLDYLQTKAVFKAARQKAGLKAPKARKGSPARLSLEEELRLIDQAYARGGRQPGVDRWQRAGPRRRALRCGRCARPGRVWAARCGAPGNAPPGRR